MTVADIRAEYERRLRFWQQQVVARQRQTERLGGARVLLFFLALGLAIWLLRSHPLQVPWLALPVLLFVVLVWLHGAARERWLRARRGVAFHERNLARLDERWSGTGPDGEARVPAQHLFARDLDLFGEGSLFQLLCTTRSQCGEATLARWMLESAAAPAIRARQECVRALAPEAELRERLALLGSQAEGELDPAALLAWAAAAPVPFSGVERGLAVVFGVLAVAALLAWAALDGVGPVPLVLVGTAEAVFAQFHKRRLQRAQQLAEKGATELSLLADLLALLEERAARLAELGARLHGEGPSASAQVRHFSSLARALQDSQRNGMYALFAFLLQRRLHQAHALETCRARLSSALPRWLDAVGEFEALLALSAYAAEHADDVFPEIVGPPASPRGGAASGATAPSEGPCLHAEGLGHPLIPVGRCVRNDLRLDHAQALLLISGSNMSGKSTLLRAAGISVVLASLGAPVRARALRLSPFAIGACIHIHDSLREGASRFWAEITRLRAIDELTRGAEPVLFLLDELLSGTNSHDRLLGARAVLARLLERGAIGLVTTHDLALAELADELAPRASNAHFEDRLVDGALAFDYRMRPGVVQRGNALALMRSLGLEV